MALRAIKTEADYRQALSDIEDLFDAQPDTREGDELDILATLIESYEQKHSPILPPDPIDALRYHMESRGLETKDLARYLGGHSRAADVLSRRRALTIGMIRRLHDELGLPAEILIKPYKLIRTAVHPPLTHERP